MSKIILTAPVLGLLLAFHAWAVQTELLTYRINGEAVAFIRDTEKHLLISSACEAEKGAYDCDAYRATRGPKLKLSIRGGGNPGSLVCRELKGKVVWGVDPRRNELTFCRFEDKSVISTGSLGYWRY